METIGAYEYYTKDLIGHGAFAVVYRGRFRAVSAKTSYWLMRNIGYYYPAMASTCAKETKALLSHRG